MATKPKKSKGSGSFNFGANRKSKGGAGKRKSTGPRVWKKGTMLERTYGS